MLPNGHIFIYDMTLDIIVPWCACACVCPWENAKKTSHWHSWWLSVCRHCQTLQHMTKIFSILSIDVECNYAFIKLTKNVFFCVFSFHLKCVNLANKKKSFQTKQRRGRNTFFPFRCAWTSSCWYWNVTSENKQFPHSADSEIP